jgi:3-deoxy-D-manno-octulosonic-acid transferase
LNALSPVIEQLRELEPECTLIVSTMTNSGEEMAHRRLESLVEGITFLPYDLPGATKKAVEAIRPDLLVLEYTEIWPNLITAVTDDGGAVALTNGRLNESLMSRYRWFFKISGSPLDHFDLLLMRTEAEAERALSLGASRDRVFVTGNTKFDLLGSEPEPDQVEELRQSFSVGDERILVAGSTHEGEERGLLEVFQRLRAVEPSLRMIIAPRYPERADKILGLVRELGFRGVRRTICTPESPSGPDADVLVVDTVGELMTVYRLATLVVVGGSFIKRGGQNILEPAAQGKPVLYGPSMMNFVDSVEVLQGRGGLQVSDFDELHDLSQALLREPAEISKLGEMAQTAVRRVSGASRKNAERLLRVARDVQNRRSRAQA